MLNRWPEIKHQKHTLCSASAVIAAMRVKSRSTSIRVVMRNVVVSKTLAPDRKPGSSLVQRSAVHAAARRQRYLDSAMPTWTTIAA